MAASLTKVHTWALASRGGGQAPRYPSDGHVQSCSVGAKGMTASLFESLSMSMLAVLSVGAYDQGLF